MISAPGNSKSKFFRTSSGEDMLEAASRGIYRRRLVVPVIHKSTSGLLNAYRSAAKRCEGMALSRCGRVVGRLAPYGKEVFVITGQQARVAKQARCGERRFG
jgi:hypothetical protein